MSSARVLFLALLLSLSLAGAPFSYAQGVGSHAPDFTLMGAQGVPRSLSAFTGRPVLLNFWATWCPPCQEELPLFQRVAEEVGNDAFQVLLVNSGEGRARAEAYLQANDIGLETLVDATREERQRFSSEDVQLDDTLEVLRRYRVRGMPTSIFIDASGVVQGVWVGLITPDRVAELLAEVGITWQP